MPPAPPRPRLGAPAPPFALLESPRLFPPVPPAPPRPRLFPPVPPAPPRPRLLPPAPPVAGPDGAPFPPIPVPSPPTELQLGVP